MVMTSAAVPEGTNHVFCLLSTAASSMATYPINKSEHTMDVGSI